MVISVAGCAGDLVESKVKRICDVKDSSAKGPAFGGCLDVIDSLLLGAPAAYWLLALFARLGILDAGVFDRG